jgi:hypothetical protein
MSTLVTDERSGDGKLHDGYGNLSDVYDGIHDHSPMRIKYGADHEWSND